MIANSPVEYDPYEFTSLERDLPRISKQREDY